MDEPTVFHNDEQGYREWILYHDSGFVLTLGTTPHLHTANCRALTYPFTSPKDSPKTRAKNTSNPKVCSDDRSALERWAREHGHSFLLCSGCGV